MIARVALVLALLGVATTARAADDDGTPYNDWTAATTTATSSLDAAHAPANAIDNQDWCASPGGTNDEAWTITFAQPTMVDEVWADASLEVFPRPRHPHDGSPARLVVRLDGGKPKIVKVTHTGLAKVHVMAKVTTIELGLPAAKIAHGR